MPAKFLQILALYAQRPIVEKHGRYALYHPSAEGVASMLTDVPYKILNAITFNVPLYFLTNLRREADAFFFFLLISFTITLVMSMLFRTVGSITRSLAQAMAPTSVVILALVMYTGFVIPTPYMLGWIRWIRHVNPIGKLYSGFFMEQLDLTYLQHMDLSHCLLTNFTIAIFPVPISFLLDLDTRMLGHLTKCVLA